MLKIINPYMDFVFGLDDEQFNLLYDCINQVKDKWLYGASSFEEAAILYKREVMCPICHSKRSSAMCSLM